MWFFQNDIGSPKSRTSKAVLQMGCACEPVGTCAYNCHVTIVVHHRRNLLIGHRVCRMTPGLSRLQSKGRPALHKREAFQLADRLVPPPEARSIGA
jgi:hypothetical protein